jgi:hypothetical protein
VTRAWLLASHQPSNTEPLSREAVERLHNVKSRHQATSRKDTAHSKDLECAIVRRVGIIINYANPNPVFSHHVTAGVTGGIVHISPFQLHAVM